MKIRNVIYTNEHPYHVSARSNNKDWFGISQNYCYGIYTNVLETCISRYGIKLHAFVLMNNHFHMILTTPNKNISEFLKYFMTRTSKGIGRKCGRINHIYGGRNHKTLITTPVYYAHCMKYVFRNPVKAKMCERVEDYMWSTVSDRANKLKLLVSEIELKHASLLPSSTYERLQWYNRDMPDSLQPLIQRAMKRQIFEIKTSQSKKKVDLEKWLFDRPRY